MLDAVFYSEPSFEGRSSAASYTGPNVYSLRGLGLSRVASIRLPKAQEDSVIGTVTYGLYLWIQEPHHLVPSEHEVGESCLRVTADVEDLGQWSDKAHFVTLYISSSLSPTIAHSSAAFAGPDLNIVDAPPANRG